MSTPKLDKLLAEWPTPERSAIEWDESAEQVVGKLGDPPRTPSLSDDALLASPLPAVAGEGTRAELHPAKIPAKTPEMSPAKTPEMSPAKTPEMSPAKNPETISEKSPESKMSKPERRHRGGFSELAKMAATPPPPATTAASPALTPPPQSAGVTRADEAASDDSGIVDLKMIAGLDAAGAARARETPLANAGLFDDDIPAAKATPDSARSSGPKGAAGAPDAGSSSKDSSSKDSSSKDSSSATSSTALSSTAETGGAAVAGAPAVSAVPAPAKKKGGGGMVILLFGGVVGLAAVAAGALFYVKSQRLGLPARAPVPLETAAEIRPAPPSTEPAVAATATSTGPETSQVELGAKPGAPVRMPATAGGIGKAAPPASVTASVQDLPQNPGAKGNDLHSAMAAAAGPIASSAGPVSTGGGGGGGNLPQKPSQGMVQGAVNAVLPEARGCLGPDDPRSIASVVFQSDGTVKSVSVTGGKKDAEGCIKTALSKAKVQPFAEAVFAFPVTVRPSGN